MQRVTERFLNRNALASVFESLRNRVGGGSGQVWAKVEFAAEEKDVEAIVCEAAEVAGFGLDGFFTGVAVP